MRTTHSACGVVINKDKVIVVSQKGQAWKIPGGHVRDKESNIEAAKREIYEETGVQDLQLVKELGTYQREKMPSESIDDKSELKVITIFLFKTSQSDLESHDADNPEARWVNIDEVESILTHPKDKAFFRKIKNKITP